MYPCYVLPGTVSVTPKQSYFYQTKTWSINTGICSANALIKLYQDVRELLELQSGAKSRIENIGGVKQQKSEHTAAASMHARATSHQQQTGTLGRGPSTRKKAAAALSNTRKEASSALSGQGCRSGGWVAYEGKTVVLRRAGFCPNAAQPPKRIVSKRRVGASS